MDENLILLPSDEVALRHGKVQAMLHEAGIDGLIVSDNANLFYLCGGCLPVMHIFLPRGMRFGL